MLNEHDIDFEQKINDILEHSKSRDGLIDNILLAQAKLTADEQLRAKRLAQLQEKFVDTDGGVQAMYELCRLRIRLWNQAQQDSQQKKKCLLQARAALTKFLELYPNNFLVDRVSKNLADLPKAE